MAALGDRVQHSRPVTGAQRRFSGSTAEEIVTRLRDMHAVTTITMFGAAFLLSALPFMILLSSFANRRIDDDLAAHLGLDTRAQAVVDRLFDTPTTNSVSALVLAVVLTAAGTVGIASTVQSVYRQIFGRDEVRAGLWRLVLWVFGLCGWLALDSAIAAGTRRLPGGVVVDGLVTLAVSTLFFWWSMHLLLVGQVGWRPLVLPAVLSAVFWLGLEVFSAFYFSSTITSDSRLYGTVGVVFSLLTWFMAIAVVVVLGALVGHVCQERLSRRRTG